MNRADGPRVLPSPAPWRRALFAALGFVVAASIACNRAGTPPAPDAAAPARTSKEGTKVTTDKDKSTVSTDKDKDVKVEKDNAPWPQDTKDRPANPPVNQGGPDAGSGGESYAHVVENPFCTPDHDPVSTFSTSVDTASYSNVRRFLLGDGRLPPADAVRVADFVNYFTYSYPQSTDPGPVSVAAGLAECPWAPTRLLARVGIQARRTDPANLPPRNLVFLVDTSGSMNDPVRLPLFKQGLRLLTERLTARDRVAIVTYAGDARLALPSTPGDRKAPILAAIDGLQPWGSTNGEGGIKLAYQLAEANRIKGGVSRVILGTDGDFNVGVTGDALVRLVEERRKDGVFLTVLGFGKGNLKDAEMEELAYRGNGHYAYIDGPAELHKVFVEQGAALEVVAKDAKVQVEFNPRRVGAYRLIGYENRLLRDRDFDDDAKQGGAMGSGHTVTGLYEIVPAAPAGDGEWLTVKMRYKDPESETSKLLSRPLTGEAKGLADAPADFRFAAAAAAFGQLLRDSPYRGDATYAAVRALAKGALGTDARRPELVEMIDAAERLTVKPPGAVKRQ